MPDPRQNESDSPPSAKRLKADEDLILAGDSPSDVEDMLDSIEASEGDYSDEEYLRLCEEGTSHITSSLNTES